MNNLNIIFIILDTHNISSQLAVLTDERSKAVKSNEKV